MKCSTCSFDNPHGFTFCGKCGSNMAESDRSSRQDGTSKSERKHVTVIFTDLSGYTEMTEQLDPEDVRLILNRVFKRITGIIEKYDGFIERYIGDSVMAVFGIPKAHEDDPLRALYAAMEIHDHVKTMNPWVEKKTGRRIFMHTGINTGLVVTGDVDQKTGIHGLTGLNINIASRLEGLSRDDEILVGANTRDLAGPFINFQALKPVKVKGHKGELQVYKVLSRQEKGPMVPNTPRVFFLGRDKELSRLNRHLDKLIHQNLGRVIFILGDPGIGKSRLIAEFIQQAAHSDIRWLKSQSSSYLHGTSYGTFLDLLKNFAGIKHTDTDREGWNKLEESLMLLFPEDVPEILPYLATVLSLKIRGALFEKVRFLDSETLGNQIFRAFYVLIRQLTDDRPLVLEFEDFHWADESSIELLNHLLPIVHDAPLLIFFVSRKTTDTPAAGFQNKTKDGHKTCYSEILLPPLKKEDILKIAGKTIGTDRLSSHLRGLIHRKCEGNPFYLEELLRSLDSGALIQKNEATGQYTVNPEAGKIPIPDTLRGLVESNIDRLDEETKDLLKIASVIGRNFLYRLLAAVEDKSIQLDKKLTGLIRENLIEKRIDSPDPEYFFYHDIIRDAAYDTILLTRREHLHRKVGEAIEILFYDQLERFYGLLSYHFAKAAQWNKARNYLVKAGDQASRIAGDSEALSHYKKAMSVHEHLFGNQMDKFEKAVYQRKLGEIYFRRGEHDKALRSLKKAFQSLGISYPFGRWQTRFAIMRQLSRQIFNRILFSVHKKTRAAHLSPHQEEIMRIFETMAWIDFYIHQERLAFDVISALNHAEKFGAGNRIIQALSAMGMVFDALGFPYLASLYHKLSITHLDTMDDSLVSGTLYLCRGYHHDFKGEWQNALKAYKSSAHCFEKIGHLKKWSSPRMMTAFILRYQGEFKKSIKISSQVHKAGVESGDRQMQGHGLQGLGMNQIFLGDLQTARTNLESSISLLKSIPDYCALCTTQTDLAICCLAENNPTSAFSLLKKNETLMIEKGFKGFMLSLLYNTLLETYLILYEQNISVDETITLRRIGHYIRKSGQYGSRSKCGLPKSLHLKGSFFWLKGNQTQALRTWENGLEISRNLGCRHETGLIYLTMGCRLGDRSCLEKAEDVFMETGAVLDLKRVKSHKAHLLSQIEAIP